MTKMPPLIWLITGASSGFGTALSLRALNVGHQVIAAVRSKSRSALVVSRLESAGAKIIELDVSASDESIASSAQVALRIYGKLDVIVNNAGIAVIGAVEDVPDAEQRRQLETNYFGPTSLIRAVLPALRAQKSGVIVNMSSVAGLTGIPGSSGYSASKFALEGASESLAKEVGPFGINVLIVEPGVFRTNFQAALTLSDDMIGEPYKGGVVEANVQGLRDVAENGAQRGAPEKGAKIILEAVEQIKSEKRQDVKRVLLGTDAIRFMENKLESLNRDLDACAEAARTTDA